MNMNRYEDAKAANVEVAPRDADDLVADRRPESAVLTEAVHMELDRLDKAIHVLGERIEPALIPSIPTENIDPENAKSSQRSSVIEGLNGVGRHVAEVRARVERITDRVDL